jgi:hypothetical protein
MPHHRRAVMGEDIMPDVVIAAKDLAPVIVAACEECEQGRRVPARIAEMLAANGLLQMFCPAPWAVRNCHR